MSGLGEQIAVLDGLTIAPGDGNSGGGSSYPDSGRWPLLPSSAGLRGPLGAQNDLEAFAAATYPADLPNVAPKKRVFASFGGGANYSGGSSYPDSGRFPTWAQGGPGLADCGCKLNGLGTLPNVVPPGRVFASVSQGANRSGGSNFPDGGRIPLLSSTIGLAGMLAGFGVAPSAAAAAAAALIAPGVLPPGRVFASAPQGANYSGGSSYPDSGRFPLLSSTIGLAGFGAAPVRRMMPQLPAMTREQLMAAIQFNSQQMVNARKAMTVTTAPAETRRQVAHTYYRSLMMLCVLRSKAGLPTLPECQRLVARMQAGAQALRQKKGQR